MFYFSCKKYYTNLSLFDCFRNHKTRQVLDCDILIKYLPRIHESCDISVKTLKVAQNANITADDSFTKLGLFEHCNFYNGEYLHISHFSKVFSSLIAASF